MEYDEEDFVEKQVVPFKRDGGRRERRTSRSRSPRRHSQQSQSQSQSQSLRTSHKKVPPPAPPSSDEEEVGPQLPVPPIHDQDHVSRETYEDVRDARDRDRAAARRDYERRKQVKYEAEDTTKPDVGHDRRVVQAGINRDRLRDFQDPDKSSIALSDSVIFAEDEIKARMKKDQERRQERAALKQIAALEKDHVRLKRLDKMKQTETKNMALLHALAKKRFG